MGDQGRPEPPSFPDPPLPPTPVPGDAPPTGRPGPSWGRVGFLLPIGALLVVLALVHVPYFVFSPGPAQDVLPLIQVRGRQTFQPSGHLLLTAVYEQQANVYQALWGWLDKTQAVVPEDEVLLPGESQQQQLNRSLSEMDTSKLDAAYVALHAFANYPRVHGRGVLVESVLSDAPADGKLFAGDLIESVDGRTVQDAEQLGRIIRSAGVGHLLRFHITAAGQSHDVTIAPVRVKGVSYPIVGIAPIDNFPFPLVIHSGNIGGPSAGLMWTLGLVDLLAPGDLTHGRIIAGTGTIDLQGRVGPIGGIAEKVVAAERAGATVFFAPAGQAKDARAVADHITIVPVRTYRDALGWLQAHP